MSRTDDVITLLFKRVLHIYVIVFITAILDLGLAIDCFKCVSINGQYPACDDPFHNNVSTEILESPCMGGRKGRDGLFPATACIKMAGTFVKTGELITIRGCALDSGGITTDTEIIRMSHCGAFYYDERYVRGCLQSCDDADACNAAPSTPTTSTSSTILAVTTTAAAIAASRVLVATCR